MTTPTANDARDHVSHVAAHARHNCMLLVLAEARADACTILRASQLSASLGMELCVAAVVPPREPFTIPASERSLLERAEQRLQQVLGPRFKAALQTRVGFFVEETVSCARDLAANLIVIAPRTPRCGRQATKIARQSGIPVLIAREYVTEKSILAATDLTDGGF